MIAHRPAQATRTKSLELGINNKLAAVLGGTKGLGRTVAEELIKEGCRVVIGARTPELLASTVEHLNTASQGHRASGVLLDCTKQSDISRAFAEIRRISGDPDILIYNNSGPRSLLLEQAGEEDFLHAFRSSILGMVWCVAELQPAMSAKQWGRIVSIGSMCVRQPHRDPPFILHNVARAAEAGLLKTLVTELTPKGITVNSVAPGSMETELFRTTYTKVARERNTTLEAIIASKASAIPARRLGRPDEVAALCAFLCSERAGYISGQTILIDGGRVEALF